MFLTAPTVGTWYYGQWKRRCRKVLRIAQEGHCFYCGTLMRGDSHRRETVDHLIPTGLGGPDELWNLVLACQSCNSVKADNMPTDDNMNRRDAMEPIVRWVAYDLYGEL